MKIYSILLNLNKPTFRQIYVAPNSDFKIAMKATKNGEEIMPELITIEGYEPDGDRYAGYRTWTMHSDAEKTSIQLKIDVDGQKFATAINVSDSMVFDVGGVGGQAGEPEFEQWLGKFEPDYEEVREKVFKTKEIVYCEEIPLKFEEDVVYLIKEGASPKVLNWPFLRNEGTGDATVRCGMDVGADLECSKDEGETWEHFGRATNYTLAPSEKMIIRAVDHNDYLTYPWEQEINEAIVITGDDAVVVLGGNLVGLLDIDFDEDPQQYTNYLFQGLFKNSTALVDIDDSTFHIPTKHVGDGTFKETFYGCSRLQTNPFIYGSYVRSGLTNGGYRAFYRALAVTNVSDAVDITCDNIDDVGEECFAEMYLNSPVAFAAIRSSNQIDYSQKHALKGIFSECLNLNTLFLDSYESTMWEDKFSNDMFGPTTATASGRVIGSFADQDIQIWPLIKPWMKITNTGDLGYVKINENLGGTYEYSRDGETWKAMTKGTQYTLPFGDNHDMYIRATNVNETVSSQDIEQGIELGDTADSNYEVTGDMMSLINADPTSVEELPVRCFYNLFKGNSSLTKCSANLGRITSEGCFQGMFENCDRLGIAPKLRAPELSQHCYSAMFHNCASLMEMPTLNAKHLVWGCYREMFKGCQTLGFTRDMPLEAPYIPNSMTQMFAGCSGLIEVNLESQPMEVVKNIIETENVFESAANHIKCICSDGQFYIND